ncbi:hypothetical protein, partial [Klebsiella pneumoniae]|uniref:hypothetical protein n=1 Tax=Klebsiella pneumoniae TaxID=573 RepID=UPI003CF862BB
ALVNRPTALLCDLPKHFNPIESPRDNKIHIASLPHRARPALAPSGQRQGQAALQATRPRGKTQHAQTLPERLRLYRRN